MTPDIEKYVPYIQAIFDGPADDPAHIPFNIADRTVRKEAEIIDTFLAILDLCGSRFGVTQVLAILGSPSVQRRFGLTEEDFELIRKWVRDTQIRWGIDEENRSRLDLYPYLENTWRAGVDGSVALVKWGVGEDINTIDIKDPIAGFVFSNKGLMFNLTIEGSKFTKIVR
jgi:exodeoxyribonuclease V gamma subunit